MATLGTKNARTKSTRFRGWLSESLKPSAKLGSSDAVTNSTIESSPASQTQDTTQSTASNKWFRKPDTKAKEHEHGLIRLTREHSNENLFASSADQPCPVDIVALHGLNGDAYTTFSASNGAFWLADFLPNEFPGARIYTFGYPSDVFFSLGTGDFESYARNLLESLVSARSSPGDKRRPLIFICHSMGGIVVKKALNISVMEAERYHDIRKSVEVGAIFFMATPHRGSAIAGLGSISATIGNVALSGMSRYTGQLRSDLLKSLKKGSKELQDIGRDFRNQTSSIKFYSFIEDETTFPSKERVVDDESGSIGVKNETIIPMIGTNHKSICQFVNKEDNGYRIVLGHLRSTVESATTLVVREITSEDQSCLQSLAFNSMNDRYDEVSYKHPNTCDWIFKHAKFSAWMISDCSLLWVKGHPGTGKSTLMASVYSQLQQSKVGPQCICLRFFFHGNGTLLQKSQLGLFRSLLHQIYRQSLSAKNRVLAAFQEKLRSLTSNSPWTLGELKELFLKTVTPCSEQKEILIFVDALDEAVDEKETKTVEVLLDYFYRLNDQIRAVKGKAKICVSCRHYPQINVGGALQLYVEDENKEDLRNFVLDKLEGYVVGWHEESPADQAALMEAIVQRAAGQFLWASLRVPQVTKSLNDGIRTFGDIHEILDAESSELSAVYKNVLVSNIDVSMRKRSLLLLQWICFAERPLSPGELRCALACDNAVFKPGQNSCEESVGYVKSDAQMRKLTKSLSGGLAVVKIGDAGESVQFIHQSVTDFVRVHGILLSSSSPGVEISHSFAEIVGITEDRLATSCVNYLSSKMVLKAMEFWNEQDEQAFDFIVYATKNWTVHAERAENNGIAQTGKVTMFDSSPRLHARWGRLHHIFNPDSYDSPAEGSSLIHTASGFNLPSIVLHLLQSGYCVNEKDGQMATTLHYAAWGAYPKVVRLLLERGANAQAKNKYGQTPMYMAVIQDDVDIVQQLLNAGCDIDDPVGDYGTALQSAAFEGNCALVERLIGLGADINVRGGINDTALQSASVGMGIEVMKLLIAKGAEVNNVGGVWGCALQAVLACGHAPMAGARLLMDSGADVNLQGGRFGNPLQAAVAMSVHDDLIHYLLQQGANVNASGGEYGSALQAAAIWCNPEITRLLLERGADVNASGGVIGTALQIATENTNEINATEVVQMLLKAGAKVSTQDGVRGNLLINAAWAGNLELVKLFLRLGIDPNSSSGRYKTAIEAATAQWTRYGQEIVKLLRRHEAKMMVDDIGEVESGGHQVEM